MKATGIILAGGMSSRMGKNKALLPLEGVTVIERIISEIESIVTDIIIVTNNFEDYSFLKLPMVEDRVKGMGPLAGIEAGLNASNNEKNIVIACDMPFVSAELGKILLQELDHCDAAVPHLSGQLHPLFATYRKNVAGAVTQSLEEHQLRIRHLLDRIHVKILKESDFLQLNFNVEDISLYNMNYPEEYEQAIKIRNKEG